MPTLVVFVNISVSIIKRHYIKTSFQLSAFFQYFSLITELYFIYNFNSYVSHFKFHSFLFGTSWTLLKWKETLVTLSFHHELIIYIYLHSVEGKMWWSNQGTTEQKKYFPVEWLQRASSQKQILRVILVLFLQFSKWSWHMF